MLLLMDPADLRAFAHRARLEVEQQKREHWARRFREGGGSATLRANHASNARGNVTPRRAARAVGSSGGPVITSR